MRVYKLLICSFILSLLFVSCETENYEPDSIDVTKVDNSKALTSPPVTIRHTRVVNNYPIFLKGKLIQVVRPNWLKNNPALNEPLLQAIATLNSLSGFEVSFSARDPSPHKLYFIPVTNQIGPTTCYARAVDIFKGNAGGSFANIQVDDEVELQHELVVRSLFAHEILHTLGLKHPDDVGFPSHCSGPDNWSGIMEPCVCSPSGNSFACRNFSFNSCEAQVLISLY